MAITLREFRTTDAKSIAKYANNIKIADNLRDLFPHPYALKDAEEFIQFAQNETKNVRFIIDLDGEAVGCIGLHPQEDIHRKNAELGYWIGEPHWGKGIISKVIPQVIKHGFSKMDIVRIFATPFPHNIASEKALIKNGFELEATLKNTIYKNGEFLDEKIYVIRKL